MTKATCRLNNLSKACCFRDLEPTTIIEENMASGRQAGIVLEQ